MSKPDGERELCTRRDTEHRGAFGGQRDSGGEHQLPALQQVRRVGQLKHVDPADPRAHAAGARDHLRAAAPDHIHP